MLLSSGTPYQNWNWWMDINETFVRGIFFGEKMQWFSQKFHRKCSTIGVVWFISFISILSGICDGVPLDRNPHNRNVLLMGVFDCFVTCTQKAQLQSHLFLNCRIIILLQGTNLSWHLFTVTKHFSLQHESTKFAVDSDFSIEILTYTIRNSI